MKCGNCPWIGLDDSVACKGEKNQRHCQLVDPNHPDYNPKQIKVILGKKANILDKVSNFTEAVVEHAKSGFENVPDQIRNKRLEICNKCDNMKDKKCLLCGCLVDEKTKWATSECPDFKWGKYDPNSSSPIVKMEDGKLVIDIGGEGCGCSN